MSKLMRFVLLSVALAVLAVAGCKKEEKDKSAAPAAVAEVVVTKPATADPQLWKAYLTSIVKKHMDKRYKRPYMYYIPPAGGDEEQRQYDAQLENVQNAVGRGILAGSMLAFGGPDSGRTAQVIIDSFALAGPKSLKGVRVVFMGDAIDNEKVTAAVAPSEADYIFEEAK